MSAKPDTLDSLGYRHRHLLGIEGLSADEIGFLLDLSDSYVEVNRRPDKKFALLRGRTVINLFFENSTRTRTSFELAGKRLGAHVFLADESGAQRAEHPVNGVADAKVPRRNRTTGLVVQIPIDVGNVDVVGST